MRSHLVGTICIGLTLITYPASGSPASKNCATEGLQQLVTEDKTVVVNEVPSAVSDTVAYQPEDYNLVHDTYGFGDSSVKNAAAKAARKFDVKNPGMLRELADHSLTSVRRNLQKIQGRERYPILAMDDGTPIYAKALGKDMFGELEMIENAPALNVNDIKAEVNTLMAAVENYPAATGKLLSEAATEKAQIEVLEAFKSDVLAKNKHLKNFTLELPELTMIQNNSKMTIEPGTKRVTFQNYDRFMAYLAAQNKELTRKTGRPLVAGLKPGYLNAAEQLALDHATNLKRLETYYGEITEAIGRHRKGTDAVQIPKDVAEMLAKMKSFYRDPATLQLKAELKPATWTTTRIKWMQAKAEASSLLFNVAPKALEAAKRKEVVEYFSKLSDAEKRALGVTKLVNTIGIISRSKVSTAATGIVFSGASATKLGFVAYELFVTDPRTKEECAEKGSEQEFNDCVSKYLHGKFALKFEKAKKDPSTVFNPDGSYKDAKILTEYQDALNRRREYQANKNLENNMAEAGRVTGETLALNPESYRAQMIKSRDPAEVKRLLFSVPQNGDKSYLEFTYPIQFNRANTDFRDKVTALVEEGISNGVGTERYNALEAEIRRTSIPLAEEIGAILQERVQQLEFSTNASRQNGNYDDHGNFGNNRNSNRNNNRNRGERDY